MFLGLGLIVTMLILVIGLMGFGVIKYRSAEVTLETPPCPNCSQVYSAAQIIPTIEFCQLVDNSARFANQMVRIKAAFIHDAGQTLLTAPQEKCEGQTHRSIKTGLDERCGACDGTRKALSIYTGFETWYDSRAIVVVVGRLGRINNPKSHYHGDDGFNILCLEQVEPIGSGAAERNQYESWMGWLAQPGQ